MYFSMEKLFVLISQSENVLCKDTLSTAVTLRQCLATSLSWDQGKQCRPRSDAAERGVGSGSALFAKSNSYKQNRIKMKEYTRHP